MGKDGPDGEMERKAARQGEFREARHRWKVRARQPSVTNRGCGHMGEKVKEEWLNEGKVREEGNFRWKKVTGWMVSL